MSAPRRAATLPRGGGEPAEGPRSGLLGRASARTGVLGAHHVALVAVLVLSGIVNTHRLSQNGYGNIFYSAGDKSMLRSLHNFFFVSFDPGGLVSVDKPPLGLWVQAASAKLFGFAPLSLLLPEAILGVVAVLLVYRALARRIGGWAGVAGALALAVFPSFVAVSRTTNVDTLLIALMILACDAGARAAETGRWRTLIWSGVLVGLAFNTKTLAAYLVVPGIALAVLLCGQGALRRRVMQLLAGGLAMVVVSFAWMAVVEATPAAERPYVGSSTDNTELGLTFSYNGVGRVGGQTGGPGKIPVGTGGVARRVKRRPGESTRTHTAREAPQRTELLPNGRARNPIAFGGPTGPLRLFGRGLGDQGAWLLPFALVGLAAFALLVLADGRGHGWRPVDRSRLALLLVFGGWLLVEAAVLSLSKGIVHPYYVSALGPGVAAMVAAGAYAFVEFSVRRDWRLLLLVAAVASTVPVELSLLHKAHYMPWFTVPLIALAAAGLAATATAALATRRLAPAAIALILLALVVAPAAYSASNWLAPVQSTFPAAGPRAAAGPGGYGVDAKHVAVDRALLSYVDAHRPGATWALLGDAANTVSPMILLGGEAAALGGFSGTDPVLDGRGLARLVADRRARYVVLGGEFSSRGGNGATAAVQQACKPLQTRSWLPPAIKTSDGLILFDCAGREAAIAAA
jgi:4-amino-4-deoxy-L-arabinose transferase-like glycosyltransferase